MIYNKNFFISKTKLIPIKPTIDGELSDNIYLKCSFCEKVFRTEPINRQLLKKINNKPHCPFCLRKSNYNDILIVSFNNVFNYFYDFKYTIEKTMYLAEIQDYVNAHVNIGLLNPLFDFDYDTNYWFIDFSRKIHVNDILNTITSIFECFDFKKTIPHLNVPEFYDQYKKVIENFHKNRKILKNTIDEKLY